ncbi:MAG TPA: peptidoglycan-binding domain-containing protein [Gammaproteobacteria bacterium]|nr:peptidoglycan-binding domain-containing protein [Gammaproteobacteria bacterium]
MKLKHIAIGSALSVLMAAPAFAAQQAGMAQHSTSASRNSMKMQSSSQGSQKHPGVKAVQKKLRSQGYNIGHVDGLWGSRSEGALKKFQQANSLKTTGTLNHKTANALGISSSQFAAFETEVGKSSAGQSGSSMKGGSSAGNGTSMGGSSMGSGNSMNGSGSMGGGHGMSGSKPMSGSKSNTGSQY